MFLIEVLFEQNAPQVPPAVPVQSAPTQQQPVPGEELSQTQDVGFPPDLLPIKKYYVIGKLKELKNQLNEYSLQNDELDTILKFSDNLSYSSLLSMSLVLTDAIAEQIARLTDGKNKD